MSGRFRVDHDEGGADVTSAKPRKLRPLGDEDNPQPGATGQPTPVVKSALKKGQSKLGEALDDSTKQGESVRNDEELTPQPPPGPPPTGKPKSALKSRSTYNLEDSAPKQTSTQSTPKAASRTSWKEETVDSENRRKSFQGRPSMFKMNLSIEDPAAWCCKSICDHYYHFTSQRFLWEGHCQKNLYRDSRKSIKLSDVQQIVPKLEVNADAVSSASTQPNVTPSSPKRKSLISSPHVILEDDSVVAIGPKGEISPLKDLLLVKRPDINKIQQVLAEMSESDLAKWINLSLDSTPPPMPPPIFHIVAAAQWEAMELLIKFKVDVLQLYQGKSMLKGWIKPNTLLVNSVAQRKGRFVGTMLGDKLEKVEAILMKAGAEQESGQVQEDESSMKEKASTTSRKRTRSIHLKCSRGVMLHTQGHPNTKYELDSNFSVSNNSSVRAAIDTESGTSYAIKAGSKSQEQGGKDPEAELWNEIVILRKLEHPNIEKLYETFEDDTHIFMVFELCVGGELFDRLVSEGSFPEETVMRLGYQMGSAIRHMHELRICHRDIRPEAFMVTDHAQTCVKLIDFSSAKEIGATPLQTKICSLHYVAPEMLNSEGYNEAVDIWSLGVVIYVMAAGVPPFDAENELDVLKAIKSASFSFEPEQTWSTFSDKVKELIKALLTRDPEKRPNIASIMEFPRMVQAETEGALYSVPRTDDSGAASPRCNQDMQKHLRTTFAMLVEKIGDDQIIELRSFFRDLDVENSGMVNMEDCRSFLIGMLADVEGVNDLVILLKSDQLSGKVNYSMFLATMTDKRRHIRRAAARVVFNSFDIDKNGNVSLYEIYQTLGDKSMVQEGTQGSAVATKEIMAIWVEMQEVFGGQNYTDKEMCFDDFFKMLPRANLDICV